jgi:uncharacterized protein (TIGR02147 family)
MHYFKPMNIYKYSDYREVIEQLIKEGKKINSKFTYAKLADVIRVQGTYLSRVLKGKAEVSSDQMYLLCEYFNLNKDEFDFMFLLLEHSRCALQARKKTLHKQIVEIQKLHISTKANLKAKIVEPESNTNLVQYYLDPYSILVHAALIIEKYRQRPQLIAPIFNISNEHLQNILNNMEKLELIRKQPDPLGYQVLQDHLQLSSESFLVNSHQQALKQLSNLQTAKLNRNQKFSFATTVTIDEKTKNLIQEEFMKFLKSVEPLVRQAPSEKILQMNFDLFHWD